MIATLPWQEIFEGGPPRRLLRAVGWIQSDVQWVRKRATWALLIGWLPLALYAAIYGILLSDTHAATFLTDFGAHSRYLIATPFLIHAEAICLPSLGKIVGHFIETGLVPGSDQARFDAAVTSTRRLLNAPAAEVIVLLLAYAAVAALLMSVSRHRIPPWQLGPGTGFWSLSPGGWWAVGVSLPLFLVLFFGWMWRIALWARLLFLISLLNLRIQPAHPDKMGGLKFVGTSLFNFSILSFAIGAVAAGTMGNYIWHGAIAPLECKNPILVLVVVIAVLFAGPLLVFVRNLVRARADGIFRYGKLAGNLGSAFEARWLQHPETADTEALDVQDFSATTDLYSITANVYQMQLIPFDVKTLTRPIIAALLPFIPVALMTIPAKEILAGAAKLLL